jgi:hypothetical protein
LQNEPDGVPEKLAEEIIAFVNEHIPVPSADPSAPAPIDLALQNIIEEATIEEPAGSDAVKAKMWLSIRK